MIFNLFNVFPILRMFLAQMCEYIQCAFFNVHRGFDYSNAKIGVILTKNRECESMNMTPTHVNMSVLALPNAFLLFVHISICASTLTIAINKMETIKF